jgi:hypothetical protein
VPAPDTLAPVAEQASDLGAPRTPGTTQPVRRVWPGSRAWLWPSGLRCFRRRCSQAVMVAPPQPASRIRHSPLVRVVTGRRSAAEPSAGAAFKRWSLWRSMTASSSSRGSTTTRRASRPWSSIPSRGARLARAPFGSPVAIRAIGRGRGQPGDPLGWLLRRRRSRERRPRGDLRPSRRSLEPARAGRGGQPLRARRGLDRRGDDRLGWLSGRELPGEAARRWRRLRSPLGYLADHRPIAALSPGEPRRGLDRRGDDRLGWLSAPPLRCTLALRRGRLRSRARSLAAARGATGPLRASTENGRRRRGSSCRVDRRRDGRMERRPRSVLRARNRPLGAHSAAAGQDRRRVRGAERRLDRQGAGGLGRGPGAPRE